MDQSRYNNATLRAVLAHRQTTLGTESGIDSSPRSSHYQGIRCCSCTQSGLKHVYFLFRMNNSTVDVIGGRVSKRLRKASARSENIKQRSSAYS